MKAKDSLMRLFKPIPWAAGAAFLIYRVSVYSPDPWQANDYVNLLFATALAGALLVTGVTMQRRAGGGLLE
jgi:hypothetical protein